MMHGVSDVIAPGRRPLQRPFDMAVVIPTIVRDTLPRAVRSVFCQRFGGDIQVLIGIDRVAGDLRLILELERECPANCVVSVLHLGYSTSVRNGGLHPGGYGGALRTILSYAAHSRRVAYLDDDNWWADDHLRTLTEAMTGKDWAFSLRRFVEQQSSRPLCIDESESVGPGAGIFNPMQGGFVDPNCLMIAKLACEPALRLWSMPLPGDAQGMTEDRNVFRFLRERPWGATGQATCFYVIHPSDDMHSRRLNWIAQKTGQAILPA